jgi:hypothetical protein
MSAAARTLIVPIVLLALLAGSLYGGLRWRETAVTRSPQLSVAFEHADHNEQSCTLCHHNFIDDTGQGACYNCHKQTAELAPAIEATFHDFCRGCHVQTRLEGEKSGPLRQCSLCH